MVSISGTETMRLPSVLLGHVTDISKDFATEILPSPPSMQSIQQNGVFKKESHHKRPVVPLSYLPVSDAGSTYVGGSGPLSGFEANARRRKRPRLDKGLNAARARPARSLANPVDAEPVLIEQGHIRGELVEGPLEENATFDANSRDDCKGSSPEPEILDQMPTIDNPPSTSTLSTVRVSNRAKGKTKDTQSIRPEYAAGLAGVNGGAASMPMENNDHCSACRSLGSLLYCDSCPRAYHFWCLDPPMEHNDIPGPKSNWHCPACALVKEDTNSNTRKTFATELLQAGQTHLPSEYILPEDIRAFFKGVATGPRGSYTDASSVRIPRVKLKRISRLGFAEDRDPYRLKDRNGGSVLCTRCGQSSFSKNHPTEGEPAPRSRRLGQSTSKATEYSLNSTDGEGQRILSCDYCSLSWHLDCLSPPLTSMPPIFKKWMCPNHARQAVANRRQPKAMVLPDIEVRDTGVPNNGCIQVIPSDDVQRRNTVAVDEVQINSRVYRVPERIIILDFWQKVNFGKKKDLHETETEDFSSPLTSLSSLAEEEKDVRINVIRNEEPRVLDVAKALCSLAFPRSSHIVHDHPTALKQRSSPAIYPEEEPMQVEALKVKVEAIDPNLQNLPEVPMTPSTELSELSPCPSHESEGTEAVREATPPLKIRIPRPLNIAVAARAAQSTPRRSSRRSAKHSQRRAA